MHQFLNFIFTTIKFSFFFFNIFSWTCAYTHTEIKWTHEISVDTGVEIKWHSEDPNFLTMEMSAPTRGYVGIGFSPSGGMMGSDIVIGWVDDNGVPEIQDFHAIGKSMPIQDSQQDYELIAGKEEGTKTTIRFRRRWETCDEKHDMTIGNDTMRLIWAWHQNDPKSSPFTLHWHGATTRGVRSVFMRSPSRPKQFPDDPQVQQTYNNANDGKTKNWDLLMDKVRIDGSKHTVYMCRIVRFPEINKKHHMIGFRPLITSGNKANVHHVSVYHCHIPKESNTKTLFAKHAGGQSGECYAPNMPPEWSKHCYTFLFSWAIGSEGEMLPDHVGSPLGESTEETSFFKLEVHYDNPERRRFTDSSGIRIFYTNKTRKFDSSVLLVGHRTSFFQAIPPRQTNFKTYSFCSQECTKNGIPPEKGLRVVSVMLHAHLIGRKILLRHIRNGKELTPIAQDNHYDFNYQQFRILQEEVIILPGDELVVECEYDTTTRPTFTFGGVATTEEMCQAIIFYYPRTSISDCRSQPELNSFMNALGIEKAQGDLIKRLNLPYDPRNQYADNHATLPMDDSLKLGSFNVSEIHNPFDLMDIWKPNHLRNRTVGDHLRSKDWARVAKNIETSWKNGQHYMFCGGRGQKIIQIMNHTLEYPRFEKYVEEKQSSCRYSSAERNGATSVINNVIFVFTIPFLVIALLSFAVI